MTPKRATSTSELEERLRFESMLSNLSSGFVNLEPSAVDREIEDAQKRVCECLGLDLAALWQLAPDEPGVLRMTLLHRPIEGPPVPDDFDSREFNPWTLERILAGETVWLRSISDAPAEAAKDCETWRYFDIRSVFCFLLFTGGESAIGAVSYHAVGEEYMLLRVGMTLTNAKGSQTITRDDIKLVTPDNKILPLMTQEGAEKASGKLAMLTKRAAMDTDSVNYFPKTANRPCDLKFFAAIAAPRANVAYDQVDLSSPEACVGVLYFHVPGGIQYGNYNLDVHFENSIVKVPMEIMNKEREEAFTKEWKAALKKNREDKKK